MSMEIVNGYVCQSCCDVALAKKGVDPAHPKDDPTSAAYDPAVAKQDKAKASGNYAPAVTFGGALAGLNASVATSTVNQSPKTQAARPYTPGSIANLTA